MVKAWFSKVLLAPQLWIGAAVVSVVASFVVDYIDAQRTADRALALRQGPPPVTALQDFDPARHVGPAREVLVRGETVLSDPVVVELGPADAPRRAVIYPLFALSESGAAAVEQRLAWDGTRETLRPMPRPEPAAEVPQALGVILHMEDGGAGETGALVAAYYGSGRYGSAVEINGERIAPGDLALVVRGAMAARNMAIADNFLAIAPYENGRLEALAPPPSSGLQRGLFWGGVTLALGAVLMSVRTIEIAPEKPPAPKRPGKQDTRVSPGKSPKARSRFQTIPTQDELYAAAARREEAKAAAGRKGRRAGDAVPEGLRSRR